VKVVLFCGGKGIRLRRGGDNTPKPLAKIGYRPILWHLMKYYAHFGHRDFILCLGYRADRFKQYFLNYDEAMSNDFTMGPGANGGAGPDQVKLFKKDIADWNITFVDTGLNSNIGMRLHAVRDYVKNEETFLANYSDGLSDLPLPDMLSQFRKTNAVGSFMCARPQQSFHLVKIQDSGIVDSIEPIAGADIWMNAGFFALRGEIFKYLKPGEELVLEPFQRLIKEKRLVGYRYNGFWAAMDTFKDKQLLESLHAEGKAPWMVWKDAEQV
jgi:glucose-1-phosphate cytidylyltransferase